MKWLLSISKDKLPFWLHHNKLVHQLSHLKVWSERKHTCLSSSLKMELSNKYMKGRYSIKAINTMLNPHTHTHTLSQSWGGLSSATSDCKALFMVVKLRAAGWRFGSSSRGIGLFLDGEKIPFPPSSTHSPLLSAETDTCSSSWRYTRALLASVGRRGNSACAMTSLWYLQVWKIRGSKEKKGVEDLYTPRSLLFF